jgi:multidrug efflux pump subunit AcrA (membrane-fusion protein)
MFVPIWHRVTGRCELQPVTRRYVAAPFEGTLRKSFVEPGDLVERNQLLAKMDGREIRFELAGMRAEYNRAAKQRDSHLAAQDYGAAQRAKLEMQRCELRTRLLEHRGENLEIRSPTKGIVVSGEMKRAEGICLTTGQTLFEIAPLDQMVVEIAVPEDDISRVENGRKLVAALDAFPGRRWQATISRIQPRAEVRDNEQIFIAEAVLENDEGILRPGMEGRARIDGEWRPLGWCLFHRAWEKLVLRWGW